MFEKKTVIVIGAGASKEFKLPTGRELTQEIAKLLNFRFEHGYRQSSGDFAICEALRVAVRRATPDSRDINPHLRAAARIQNAMPQALSIDNLIDAHQGDSRLELCGKLAIVRAILEAERGSLLHVDPARGRADLDYNYLPETWLIPFMQLLTENCRANELEGRLSRIALIIFNYDRCVEHFLFHALQNYYGIDADHAAALIRRIEIFHPYGTVGALPWQQVNGAIAFGAEPEPHQLLNLASQIKTFTEGTDPDSSDIASIQKWLVEAQIVVFLGFAYHKMNLRLLRNPERKHPDPGAVRYFGTAYGISHSDCGIIRTELSALAGARPENIELRNDLACAGLFREYWRSLSLS